MSSSSSTGNSASGSISGRPSSASLSRKAVPQYFPAASPQQNGQHGSSGQSGSSLSQSPHPLPLTMPLPGIPQTVIDHELAMTPSFRSSTGSFKRPGMPGSALAPLSLVVSGNNPESVPPMSTAHSAISAASSGFPTPNAASLSSPNAAFESSSQLSYVHPLNVRSHTPSTIGQSPLATPSSSAFLGNAPHPMLASRGSISGSKPSATPTVGASPSPIPSNVALTPLNSYSLSGNRAASPHTHDEQRMNLRVTVSQSSSTASDRTQKGPPKLALNTNSESITGTASLEIQSQIAMATAASAAAAANAAVGGGGGTRFSQSGGGSGIKLQLPGSFHRSVGGQPSTTSFAHIALDQTLDRSFEISKNGTVVLTDSSGRREIAINMQGDLRVNNHTFIPIAGDITNTFAPSMHAHYGIQNTLDVLHEGQSTNGDQDDNLDVDHEDIQSVGTSTTTSTSTSLASSQHALHGAQRRSAKALRASRNLAANEHIEYGDLPKEDYDQVRALRSPGAMGSPLAGQMQSNASRRPSAPQPILPSASGRRSSISSNLEAGGFVDLLENKEENVEQIDSRRAPIRPGSLVMLGRLGKGASAVVRRMLFAPDFSIFAVKSISVFDDALRPGLKSELRVLTEVKHPHLLRLIGGFSEDAIITLVLEHMNRGDFQGWIESKTSNPESSSPLSIPCLCEAAIRVVARGTLLGLAALHARNHVHRDLKPGNILLGSDGAVKLADFGLMKQVQEENEFTVAQGGTVVYLSPERLLENKVYPSGDVWALGLSVLYAATGHMPVPNNYWHLDGFMRTTESEMPFDLDPRLFSAKMRDFVRLALRKDPVSRPSAADLINHPWIATPFATSFAPWYLTPEQIQSGMTREDLKRIDNDVIVPSDPDASMAPWRALKTPTNAQVTTLLDALTDKQGPWYGRNSESRWDAEDARKMRYVARQMGWRWDDLLAALIAKLGSSFEQAAVAAAVSQG